MQRYKQYAQPIPLADGSTVISGLPYLEFQYSGEWEFYEVQPQEAGRLDIIAYKFFQDFSMWPLIAWANGIFDPIQDCLPGKILQIPLSAINQTTDIIPSAYPGVK